MIWLGYAGTDRNPVDGPYMIDGEPVYSALAVGGGMHCVTVEMWTAQ